MKTKPCNCDAYDFPHRLDGGDCRKAYNREDDDVAEIARDFERTEAQAYNRERSIFDLRNLT